LAETLRTMAAVLVTGACVELSLGGRRLSAAEIVADPELAGRLAMVVQALASAARDGRK